MWGSGGSNYAYGFYGAQREQNHGVSSNVNWNRYYNRQEVRKGYGTQCYAEASAPAPRIERIGMARVVQGMEYQAVLGPDYIRNGGEGDHELRVAQQQYEGVSFVKEFIGHGSFVGTVQEIWRQEDCLKLFAHITYEDGDKEDISLPEFRAQLRRRDAEISSSGQRPAEVVRSRPLRMAKLPKPVLQEKEDLCEHPVSVQSAVAFVSHEGHVLFKSNQTHFVTVKESEHRVSPKYEEIIFPIISNLVKRKEPQPGLKKEERKQPDFTLSEAELLALWNFHAASLICEKDQPISDVLELQFCSDVSSDRCFEFCKGKLFHSASRSFIGCDRLFENWVEIGLIELVQFSAPFILFLALFVLRFQNHFAYIRDWLYCGWDPPWTGRSKLEFAGKCVA